jgi:DNA-binding response OmpR family regulator
MDRDRARAPRFKEETMHAVRLGKLLLVEDEHRLRHLVAQFLRSVGYQVVEAGDGPEGVARFGDSGPFDLALVDLNLPGCSGVEVCQRIKSARPDQRVMICSAAIVEDHECALAAVGVHHFLTKPYHPEDLIAHIHAEIGTPVLPKVLSSACGS